MRLTTLVYALIVLAVELAWIAGLVYGVIWLVRRY
jgi:hypothetical protein